MRYRLIDGDEDVPQEMKIRLLIMTINRAVEEMLLELWRESKSDPSGIFSVEIVIPDTWQKSRDRPPVNYKVVDVDVRTKKFRY